jgi:hypothetical protein
VVNVDMGSLPGSTLVKSNGDQEPAGLISRAFIPPCNLQGKVDNSRTSHLSNRSEP